MEVFEWSVGLTEEQRALKNVENMLNLRKGDLAFDRGLGISQEYVDKPMSDMSSDVITEVEDMITDREPRVQASVELADTLNADSIIKVVSVYA